MQSLRPAADAQRRHHRGDEIFAVPGFQGELPSRQYGGYVTVDEPAGRHLYYYFVESQRSPANDPVVLWLNGGPGCSSFDGERRQGLGPEAIAEVAGSAPKQHLSAASPRCSGHCCQPKPIALAIDYAARKFDSPHCVELTLNCCCLAAHGCRVCV
jgi:serine carboxypeptidase-like clade 1